MPELPEVQTITSDLKKHLEGYTIETIQVESGYNTIPSNELFLKEITGQKIATIYRIAKNIVLELESGDAMMFHLAMTGQLLLSDPKTRKLPWERVTFVLTKKDKKLGLKFRDMRTFGKAVLVNKDQIQKVYDKYGPEPLNEKLTAQEFLDNLKGKRTTVKNALLDQAIVSGLGNIYATDALFMSKIHPETPTKNITLGQAEKLLKAAKEILLESIEHRGSTLGDKMYVDAYGKMGSHQNYFRVYGKEKCSVCDTKVEVIKINGRGTYFCPTCQPEGNQLSLL